MRSNEMMCVKCQVWCWHGLLSGIDSYHSVMFLWANHTFMHLTLSLVILTNSGYKLHSLRVQLTCASLEDMKY